MGDEELEEEVGASEEEGLETGEESEETGESEGVVPKTKVKNEDDAPVPLKRFNKVYGEMKTTTEKFDLFKRLGQDKYYDVYPDEKPEELEETLDVPLSVSEAADMIVRGGAYDGQTLGEVAQTDPLSAMGMFDEYRAERRDTIEADKKLKTESETEESDFKNEHAKAAFDKEYNGLSSLEASKVDEIVDATLGWMEKTGRGGANLFDAHFLMNRDKDIATAKGSAAASAVDSISRGVVQSISNGKGSQQTGYESFLSLSRDKLTDELNKMSEDESVKFYKDAPDSVRNKFPELPW